MDIKLKKTHKKLKVIIILLTIVVPAIAMVSLYPKMGRLANEYIEKESYTEYNYFLNENFVRDAVALLSGEQAQKAYSENIITETELYLEKEDIKENVNRLKSSGVVYAYAYTDETNQTGGNITDVKAERLANYVIQGGATLMPMDLLEEAGFSGCYIVEFGTYGAKLCNGVYTVDDVYCDFDVSVAGYPRSLVPKNMKAVFFVENESEYIDVTEYSYNQDFEGAYFEIGALVPMFISIVFVAFVALVLPLFKRLETGNERVFKIPAEIACVIGGLVAFAMVGMFYLMSYTNYNFLAQYFDANGLINILGYTVSTGMVYKLLIVANVVCWIICFAFEYMVITIVRQFVSHPVIFIKERFIVINLSRKIYKWLKIKVKKVYVKTVDIIKSFETNKLLLLVLIVNFVVAVLAIFCDIFIGVPVFLVYTVVAYILVYRKYQKVCMQFEEVMLTVEKMAEGNLKIEIEEDLGVFEPIGVELAKIKDSFEKALIEEAKSRDMKTELITNVSHDLKTPLTAIITYIDLLKNEGITEEERQQYINTLDIKSQRLKALIEDLFEVSKANSGNVNLNKMDVDVVGLMKQVRLELEDKITESNVKFKWIFPEEKVIVSLDGQKTYRIFANLINNITKYSLSGSRAYVEVLDRKDSVIITFKNISATEIDCDVENLTERFVRGDASRNSEGSGLGLAIVKSFVELQDGKFSIEVDGDLFKATIQWKK